MPTPQSIIRENLREVPDFPRPGILFKDITTLFQKAEVYETVLDELVNSVKDL